MSIQDTLIAWGRGRAMNSAPNGYPNKAAFARLISRGNINIPPLGEDEMIRLDAIVSGMKGKKPTHHIIICLAYVEGWRDARIASKCRFEGQKHSRSWVREQRIAGEAWIEAKLE